MGKSKVLAVMCVLGLAAVFSAATASAGVVNVTTETTLFFDDFEGLGSNVSHTDYANNDGGDYDPIGGNPGSWVICTYAGDDEPEPDFIQVTDAAEENGPGAYQGNNYLRIVRQAGGAEIVAKMTFTDQSTMGDHIRFSQMFYAAEGSLSPIQVIGKGSDGTNRFNVLTDYSTPNVASYVGVWPPGTGVLEFTHDQWEEWVIDYNIGDTVINISIGENRAINVPILTGGDLASILIMSGESSCMVDDIDPSILIYPGDANKDGKVDEADASTMASNWLRQEGVSWRGGDFNDDGKVDDIDATMMATNWHKGVSGAAGSVPEPSMFVLLICGVAGLAIRRWSSRR